MAPIKIIIENILGIQLALEINFSRSILEIAKHKASNVNANPMQQIMIFPTAYKGLFELTSNVIREIRYPLQQSAHAIDVRNPKIKEPTMPSLFLALIDLDGKL